jgi:hypothetical protein
MMNMMEMLGRVFVLRRIAAAHVSAYHAHAQVDPGVSGFHTIFTNVLVRSFNFDLVEMLAFNWHTFPCISP